MGAAFVALLLFSGELGVQASAVTQSRLGETPLRLGPFGVQLSATSETRAGEAPLLPGEDPRLFVAEILTPLLGLELRRHDLTFQMFYGPRIFWEDPAPITGFSTELLAPDPVTRIRSQNQNQTSSSGPLILHSAGLTLDAKLSPRVTFQTDATGSVGSPDYTALPLVLGTVQGALPPIANLASGTAAARVKFQTTRRWELDLAGTVFHWQFLNAPDSTSTVAGQTSSAGQTLVTGQTFVTVQPGALFTLTPRDGVGLDASIGEASYSNGVEFLVVTPAVTWRRHISPLDRLRLSLGVTYARSLATPPGAMTPFGSSGSTAAPIGSLDLTSQLFRREGITVLSNLTGGVDLYVDPILGIALPRGEAGAGLTAIAIPLWTITLRGDFATALKDPPLQAAVVGQPPPIPLDETAFSVSLSGRRRVSENMFLEVGGLWADRGPVLSTPDFSFHQRQLWVHVSLTVTTRPIPRLAQSQK